MKPRLPLSILCLLLSPLVVFAQSGTPPKAPDVPKDGPAQIVTLENAVLRLDIRKSPAPFIDQIIHKGSGQAVAISLKTKSLFLISLAKQGGGRYIAAAFEWKMNGNHIDFWELQFDGDKPYVVYSEADLKH